VRVITQLRSFKDKIFVVRVDWNVPVKKGKVMSNERIIRSLPTIKYLQRKGGKVILVSHLGRPNGPEDDKSLMPIGNYISKQFNLDLQFISNNIIESASDIHALRQVLPVGKVLLLENIRYYPEERKNAAKLAKALASLGDFYIIDAFGMIHRKEASVDAVQRYSASYAGLLMREEIQALDRVTSPKGVSTLIVGGAKLDTKFEFINKLSAHYTNILLGSTTGCLIAAQTMAFKGQLAFPVDEKVAKLAMRMAQKYKNKFHCPVDYIVGNQDGNGIKHKRADQVESSDYVYDIGPETIKLYSKLIRESSTMTWNGPMGWFEKKKYSHGTRVIASVFAKHAKGRAFGVIGGGETIQAVADQGILDYVDHVCTGGGAMMHYLSGGKSSVLTKLSE
jgi:phosphoglycerate kinase